RSPDPDADAAPVPRSQRVGGPAAQARVGVRDPAAGADRAGSGVGHLDLVGMLGPAARCAHRPRQPGLALPDPQRLPVALDAYRLDPHIGSVTRVLACPCHPLTAPLARPLITRWLRNR